jgi:benzoyl-CoA reductase/2-hydroxyglutaryl-CoA dehydratase subunit BcrC/BadD/HgdB
MKTVAYSSPLIPVEWLAAHGVRPWRLLPDGNTNASRTHEGLCPFAQAVTDDWQANPSRYAALVLATTCDQMRRWHEILAARSARPVFLMNIPASWQGASSAHMYMDELARLGRFLESLSCTEPTDKQLAQTMLAFAKARQVLQASLDHLPARLFVEYLHKLCQCATQELDAFAADITAQASSASVSQAGIPIAMIGGAMTARDLAVLDLIELAGGRIVLSATEGGARGLPAIFNTESLQCSPRVELFGAYFGAIGEIFRRPDSMLFDYLTREISRCNPKGIVLVRQVWCDLWHAQVGRLRQHLDLPMLELDLDGQEPPATLTNRVHAFIEVLQ